MNNPQRTVFIMLAAILLLEFGSLTKFQRVWQLAFQGNVENTMAIPNPNGGTTILGGNPNTSIQPSNHPRITGL